MPGGTAGERNRGVQHWLGLQVWLLQFASGGPSRLGGRGLQLAPQSLQAAPTLQSQADPGQQLQVSAARSCSLISIAASRCNRYRNNIMRVLMKASSRRPGVHSSYFKIDVWAQSSSAAHHQLY